MTGGVASTAYRRAAVPEGALRLDGTEGAPPCAAALAALDASSACDLRRYPDAGPLEALLAERHRIEPRRVLVTAGADEALERCLRRSAGVGRSVLLPDPTFEMIPRHAAATGARLDAVAWREGAFPVDEFLRRIDATTGAVVVVSPNNPTGLAARGQDIVRLAHAVPDALVVADLAYVEYDDVDPTRELLEVRNIVVVRTLSKAWGLAGLRVGYVLGDASAIAGLRSVGSPYPVARPSLAAAAAALSAGHAAVLDHVRRVRDERMRLSDLLLAAGLGVRDSRASFVLADAGERAPSVAAALLTRGVAVRSFEGRQGLDGSLRISLPGDDDAFSRLTSALTEVLR